MKKLSILLLSFFMFLVIGSPIQAEANVDQDLFTHNCPSSFDLLALSNCGKVRLI